jgi:outer membrane protein
VKQGPKKTNRELEVFLETEMKSMICVLALVFFSPLPAEDLPSCQRSALVNSQELSIAELQTLIAREKIEEIHGINLPKISVDGSYNIRDKHPGVARRNPLYHATPTRPDQDPTEIPEQPRRIKTIAANKDVATSKVSLIVPLYDCGHVNDMMRAQRSNVEATIHQRDRIEQDLLFAVAQSYYKVLEGCKIESVVLQSIKVLTQQLATATDLYSVGFVTKNDVLVVEVQLAQRQQELIQARHNTESALASLSRLVGKTIDHSGQLTDICGDVFWEESLATFLSKAVLEHPELKKIQSKQNAAVSELEAIRTENYPQLTAFVNFHSSSDNYLLHRNWLHTGFGICIPIFDGGIVDSKLAQKKKQMEQLSLTYEGALEDIRLQVQKAYLNVDSAYSKIPVALKSIDLAEENLKIDKDLFEEGLIVSDDLLNDEERLAQARSNYFQSLYSFQIAKCQLDYAAGLICL